MKIAVLALQGDFAEHAAVFERMNCEILFLRQLKDLQQQFDALAFEALEGVGRGTGPLV